jgi:hypothetical protein
MATAGATSTDYSWYWVGYKICFVILFLMFWAYCLLEYGFLIGAGIGWLPSAIAAAILSFFWPIVLPALLYFFMWVADKIH